MFINYKGQLIIDSLDYFLLAVLISFYGTEYVINKYFPGYAEKQARKRLVDSIIAQSKVLSPKERRKLKIIQVANLDIPPYIKLKGGMQLQSESTDYNIKKVVYILLKLFKSKYYIPNANTIKSASLSQLPHIPYGGDITNVSNYQRSLIQKIIFCLRILQILSGQCCERIILFFIALLYSNTDKRFIYFILKSLIAYLYRLNIFCYILPQSFLTDQTLICWIYTGTGGLVGVASAWLKVGGVVGMGFVGPLSLLIFGGRAIGQSLGYGLLPTFDESDPDSWKKLIENLMRPIEDDLELWRQRVEAIRPEGPFKHLHIPPRSKIEAMIDEAEHKRIQKLLQNQDPTIWTKLIEDLKKELHSISSIQDEIS